MTHTHVGHWIDGKPMSAGRGQIPIYNPATGLEAATVDVADEAVVNAAVASSLKAAGPWGDTPPSRRVQILYRFRGLLLQNIDRLAAEITEQHGKTLDDARGEIMRGLEAVELACGAPGLLKGEMSEQTGTNIDTYSTLHPLGVGLGISPFNFPVMIPLMMLSVAIAAGNAFILKPSEQDPGPALILADLAREAGLPDGVLNVVNGDRETVAALIDHPGVSGVSFVGSTPVAQIVYQRAAAAGKRVQAFGGAKNHLVVMPDANLDAVADALSSAAFGSAGQRCMAITTAVAVGGVGDALAQRMRDRAQAVRMGSGADIESEMGPLINAAAQTRARKHVGLALAEGAVAVVDRSNESVPGYEAGYFVGPTVIDGVTPQMDIYREELFAPVLIILRVDTLEEAIELIRVNKYGNGAAIFTRDGNAAHMFQRRAAAGMVGINVPIPVPVAPYAVAGWKASSFGDTGLNNASWRFWTRTKYITSRWADPVSGVDLGFRPN